MDEPAWLSRLMVDAIHADLLAQHGGLRGVRDENALESALARSRNRWAHDPDADLLTLAAAYGYGIARNHPFNDGNKRTAFMLTYVFLGINDYELDVPEPEAVRVMIELADHKMSEERFATWIRERVAHP